MGWFANVFGGGETAVTADDPNVPEVDVEPAIELSDMDYAPLRFAWNNGDKFAGGFGPTKLLTADYWTLRARSAQLFETNPYARGVVRRLVSNIINTGLHLEATPYEGLLDYPEDGLADWAESTENRFEVWGKEPRMCDAQQRETFGALQHAAELEALVSGDVLVMLAQDPDTHLPQVRLVSGAAVRTPWPEPNVKRGHTLKEGVEQDAHGRHVAYWIRKPGGTGLDVKADRVPAWGPKTGRRMAWLYYGTDKRHEDVRGTPLLSLVLQSLQEIDRFRDATQRKAHLLSQIAAWVEKTEDKPGSKPLANGAIRRGTDTTSDSQGTARTFQTAEMIPGLIAEEMQHGEKVHAFQTNGTVESFGDFERAIIATVAWSNGVPPEILTLSFSSNYSASQAAINEFKICLNLWRQNFGEQFCQPIYSEWLLSQVLAQRIEAPRLLEHWRDPGTYDLFCAWAAADWTGHIKPAVDLSKLVKGYDQMIASGLITRDRASRELTGTKYSKNVQKLARENAQLADANGPMVALEKAAPVPPQMPPEPTASEDDIDAEAEAINQDDEPDDDGLAMVN